MSAEQRPTERAARRPGTVGAALVVALALAGAISCAALTIGRASDEVYGIPGWGVAVTAVLLAVVVGGCALIWWSRQPAFSALVLAGVAFGVLGLLAALSFGPLALLVAAALLTWAASRSRARSARAAAGAVLAGAPLPLLAVFAMAGPLVDCEPNGVTNGENVFLTFGSGGGSGGWSGSTAGDAGGAMTGHAEGPGYDYTFVCRDGRLVEFELHRR